MAKIPAPEHDPLRRALRATLAALTEARTLPRETFVGERAFARDRGLIDVNWFPVAHVSELAALGFVATEPFGERVVVTFDGRERRAFVDRCVHRATPTTEGLSGRLEGGLVCPYHGLRFDLGGAVRAGAAEHLCVTGKAMRPVRVAERFGFLFATLGGAPELDDWLAASPAWLERAELASLRLLRRSRHVVAANWKLLVENFQESHHFPTVHAALEGLTPWRHSTSVDLGGPWLGGTMDLAGSETVSLGGGRRGRPFVAHADDRGRVHDALLFPLWLTSLQPDYFLSYRLLPGGPERTEVVADIFVHRDARDEDCDDVTGFWDVTNAEDRAICERQQRGVAAPSYEPGQYATSEDGMHAFDRRIASHHLAALEGDVAPPQSVDRQVAGATTRSDPPPASERARPRAAPIVGLFGRPYLDLEHLVDDATLATVDREVTLGLAQVESSYTGGSLKWMGVVAPWCMDDGYRDLMHAVEAMSDEELATLVSLSDDPDSFDRSRLREATFGDETDHPLNRAQMRYLAYRHGVYFPWKVCYHLLENDRWDDKHSGAGKVFVPEALEVFPETVALLRSLPFKQIGRVVLFGLEPNDHAPLHRDTEPGSALTVAQSISLCPRGDKRFYLCNDEHDEPLIVDARAYWFNDMDYHGVLADPFFRYSIRVDGVFEPSFVRDLERRARRG